MVDLTPAQAALAGRIAAVQNALRDLDAAREPIAALDRIKAGAIVGEADALRGEIEQRNRDHASAVDAWIASGARGERPTPSADLIDLERRAGEIAAKAADAAPKLARAQGDLAAASDRVRATSLERDAAIPGAAVDAAANELASLESAVMRVLVIEAKLRGLADALRVAASGGGTPYLAAANKIEELVALAKRRPAAERDPTPGRRLLEELRTDATAAL
jgi:hypothetical protein